MQGQLFSQDFLLRGIRDTRPYKEFCAEAFTDFRGALSAIYGPLSTASVANGTQGSHNL